MSFSMFKPQIHRSYKSCYFSFSSLHLSVFWFLMINFGVLEPSEFRRYPKSVFYAETNFAGGEATESSNWLSALVHRSLVKFQSHHGITATVSLCASTFLDQSLGTKNNKAHLCNDVLSSYVLSRQSTTSFARFAFLHNCVECHCDENLFCRWKQRRLGVFCWGLAHEPSEVDLWC